MLKSAANTGASLWRFQAAALQASKAFSVSSVMCAPPRAKGNTPAVKTKSKVRVTHNKKEKVKKSGMTPHDFKDAVRTLNFESFAKDLGAMNIPTLASAELQQLKDTVVAYEPEVEEQIELMGGFKKYQHHELFRKHYSMVTDNTVELHKNFVDKMAGSSKSNRFCLLGPKGMGKSTLVSQAQAMARSKYGKDVILLHIEEPELFVQGFSDYVYNPTLKLYHQPMFTKRWIKKLRVINEDAFKRMPLLRDVSFNNKKGSFAYKKDKNNLHEYLVNCHDFGILGPTDAFSFFMEHIKAYSKDFPVLFSVDNINAIFEKPFTKYFNKDLKPIHFSEFEIGKLIQDLMNGDVELKKGGVLLAETSDLGASKTLRVGLKLETLDPYAEDLDHDVASKMLNNGGITAFPLTNLNKDQARRLMEFWDDSGVLQVRDYATKPLYKRLEEVEAGEQTVRVGQFVNEMDKAEMYEKTLQKTYFISGGNPGMFLRNNVLRY